HHRPEEVSFAGLICADMWLSLRRDRREARRGRAGGGFAGHHLSHRLDRRRHLVEGWGVARYHQLAGLILDGTGGAAAVRELQAPGLIWSGGLSRSAQGYQLLLQPRSI